MKNVEGLGFLFIWLNSKIHNLEKMGAEMENAAQLLVGRKLEGGWTVLERVPRSRSGTGGHFSAGYIVENENGRKGFLKALDYSRALGSQDPAAELQALTEAFNFERNLLMTCEHHRMDRVVRAIDAGKISLPELGTAGVVQYLIFELADGDIRRVIDATEKLDLAWILRALHHICGGLWQLHRRGIAHQDLKPSNVLVFDMKSSKLGDLGRAALRGTPGPSDTLSIAGQTSYAPPDLLYDDIPLDWNTRRLSCDLYLLGSMIVFFFTGVNMTGLVQSFLDPNHRKANWKGSFSEVLPFVRKAHNEAIAALEKHLPQGLSTRLMEIVRELCDPQPKLRGRRGGNGTPQQYSLEQYLSEFNLLAEKVEYGLVKG